MAEFGFVEVDNLQDASENIRVMPEGEQILNMDPQDQIAANVIDDAPIEHNVRADHENPPPPLPSPPPPRPPNLPPPPAQHHEPNANDERGQRRIHPYPIHRLGDIMVNAAAASRAREQFQAEEHRRVQPYNLQLPMLSLLKVSNEGIHNVMPEGFPPSSDTQVERGCQISADMHSAWQIPDPMCLVGLSCGNHQWKLPSDHVTPRSITSSKCVQTGEAKPTLSATVSALMATPYNTPVGTTNINNYLNIRDQQNVEPYAMVKLAQAVTITHPSWQDEAPVVRALAGLIIAAPDAAYLRSTPSLAYDCSFISVQTKVADERPNVRVNTMFCDLDSYFLYLHGLRRCTQWDRYDLQQNVIIIPIDPLEQYTKTPVIRAMINTTMAWWYGRITKGFGVDCHGDRSANSETAYLTPLAALLRLDSTKVRGEYNVLFVTDAGMPSDVFTVSAADGRDIDIPRLGSNVEPMEIGDDIVQYTETQFYQDLRGELMMLLRWYAEHGVGNSFQQAVSIVAETCYQIPMPKIYKDGEMYFGYCWDKHEANDPQITFESKRPVAPCATIQDQMMSSGYGWAQSIMANFVLRYQTPLGLLQPGRQKSAISTADMVKVSERAVPYAPYYSCNEADGLARLAIAFGPMVELKPWTGALLETDMNVITWLQEAARGVVLIS